MGNNNNIKSNRVYYISKKIIYLFMINIYFLISISPFLLYFLLSGTNISIYILLFLAILIGPAFSTVLSVLGRVIKEEETESKKDFLYFYKLNFIQGIFAASIINLILLMCYLDISYFYKLGNRIFAYIFIAISFFTIVTSIYIFPIIARINAKTKDIIKLSIKLTIKKLYITLTISAIVIIFIFIIRVIKISLIGVLCGPILLGYLILFLEKDIMQESENYLKEIYCTSEVEKMN